MGETQAGIVRYLASHNYRTRSGSEFTAPGVRSIRLNRPFYEGLFKNRSGEWVQGQHEPLIEESF